MKAACGPARPWRRIRPSAAQWALTWALAGVRRGWVPKTLKAAGALPGLVCPDSLGTPMAAKAIPTRWSACQGVAPASWAGGQRPSDARPPLVAAWLPRCEDCPSRRAYPGIISIREAAGLRIQVGAGVCSPLSGKQGPQGGPTP
jgi:hypothetical protein